MFKFRILIQAYAMLFQGTDSFESLMQVQGQNIKYLFCYNLLKTFFFNREGEYLCAIGHTPLGFYLLSKTDKLLRTVLLQLEKQENCWSLMPWKQIGKNKC